MAENSDRELAVAGDEAAGQNLIRASWIGTVVYVAVAIPATVAPDTVGDVLAVLSVGLFAAGSIAMLWAFFVAVGRSRTETIGVGGLYFLAGCAPTTVQRTMMAALAVQVLVAIVTASVRLYTPLAFGILVPMYGLGLAGLWGALHGTFPPRGEQSPDSRPPPPVGGDPS